jgi:HAD superfamily hydrolase (TIGR01509 family)
MNAITPFRISHSWSLKDRIARAGALIFDVDGTLAETEAIHRCAFNAAFREFHIAWYWDRRTYKNLLRVAGGKERIDAFARMQSPPISLPASQLAELHRIKTRHYSRLIGRHACGLRPGVDALIRDALARGQTLAIATTTTLCNVDELLSIALDRNWRNLFAAVVAGDEVSYKKPAPDVYLEVLARLRRPASDCIAIEDSANGLKAASAAGVPVLITRSDYFRDDDFSSDLAVVDELTQLA